MKKYKKWVAAALVLCIGAATAGIVYYRNATGGERKLSLIYIPKVVDGTNDFWSSLILGVRMAAKEYNVEMEVMAPERENDVERQNKIFFYL